MRAGLLFSQEANAINLRGNFPGYDQRESVPRATAATPCVLSWLRNPCRMEVYFITARMAGTSDREPLCKGDLLHLDAEQQPDGDASLPPADDQTAEVCGKAPSLRFGYALLIVQFHLCCTRFPGNSIVH